MRMEDGCAKRPLGRIREGTPQLLVRSAPIAVSKPTRARYRATNAALKLELASSAASQSVSVTDVDTDSGPWRRVPKFLGRLVWLPGSRPDSAKIQPRWRELATVTDVLDTSRPCRDYGNVRAQLEHEMRLTVLCLTIGLATTVACGSSETSDEGSGGGSSAGAAGTAGASSGGSISKGGSAGSVSSGGSSAGKSGSGGSAGSIASGGANGEAGSSPSSGGASGASGCDPACQGTADSNNCAPGEVLWGCGPLYDFPGYPEPCRGLPTPQPTYCCPASFMAECL
jgi:hypothetical protein